MRYFVKLAGKAFGPLEEEKIVEMYQSGRLKAPVEISRDKKDWNAIDIILPAPALSPAPSLPPSPSLPDLSLADTLLDENFEPLPVAVEITQSFNNPNDSVWYYSADGRNGYGPVSKSNLATMLQCDMLKPRSLVWRQGENSRPISTVPELMDILRFANPSTGAAGGVTSSVQTVLPAPNNPMFGRTSSPNLNNSGLGSFASSPSDARSNSSSNMLDLLDDPIFRNEGLDQGRAPGKSSVGQTSRMNFVLMALFLGQLGIHNFYAKRMDIAIIQLFIGLSNLVVLIVISFVSLATEGEGGFLFIIPALVGLGLEIWAVIETFTVTKDGTGKLMY